MPNREFKFFHKRDLTGSSLNRDITLVDINGKSGEFLGFHTLINELEKTINAIIKIIIDGLTVIDIDYTQTPKTPSGYNGTFNLLIAPLESLRMGDTSPDSIYTKVLYSPLNLTNKKLTRVDGSASSWEFRGMLLIDKIPFKKSLKIIVFSNAKIVTLEASCYVNK